MNNMIAMNKLKRNTLLVGYIKKINPIFVYM